MTIISGLLRFFSRLVVLLGFSLRLLPLFEPNLSRPSRPSRIEAMRSSYVAFAFFLGPKISASPRRTASPSCIGTDAFSERFRLEPELLFDALARSSFSSAKSAGVRIYVFVNMQAAS